jgi:pimeloyl-ACP methyl ester carboxylesterase
MVKKNNFKNIIKYSFLAIFAFILIVLLTMSVKLKDYKNYYSQINIRKFAAVAACLMIFSIYNISEFKNELGITSFASVNMEMKYNDNENAKETLVFLNGLSQSTVSWILTTPSFKNDYRIVLIDFIFQGQSDKIGEWRSFDTHARDVVSVLDYLKINKAIVAGLSYGSLVAQYLGVHYGNRISKLLLMSTFAVKTPYYEAIELSWWRALEFGGYGLMLDIMLPTVLSEGYFKNPLIPIDMMKQARQEANEDKQALFKLMRATKERPDYRPELKKITVPTIIIQGEKDTLFPVHMAQEVVDSIPNSKLVVIPFAGHTLNLEAIPQMVKAMKEFISAN